MSTHRLIVFTEPKAGQEAEYNDWYNNVHLKDVLEIDGFVAAQRFELAPTQIASGDGQPTRRYLAIYEIEAESLPVALEKLNAGSGTMEISPAMDMDSALATAYSAIGPRVESA